MSTDLPTATTPAPGAPPPAPEPSRADVMARASAVFAANDAIQLATAGGPVSPWVLGAYFVADGADLYLFLETSGKSARNVVANAEVAFLVSRNDAQQDFVQGRGTAIVLPPEEEPAVRARLLAKMPWFQTYTPVLPVRIEIAELFVSSLSAGWFPAKRWQRGG
jgi:nitroimidazol reductase NimA-like FMN-containing flavoprotein (pyridoxamine 5'-phosphate oxidase superfamily)